MVKTKTDFKSKTQPKIMEIISEIIDADGGNYRLLQNNIF